MTSDEESNSQKSGSESKEKRLKKSSEHPKSPKTPKTKKSHFIIKKLKLKSKSVTESSSPTASRTGGDQTSSKGSSATSTLERQTPEGDDNFVLTKSASETNLQETWRSAENFAEITETLAAESAKTSEKVQSEEKCIIPDRTKSLDNLKAMVTYGELLMDKSPETVMTAFSSIVFS